MHPPLAHDEAVLLTWLRTSLWPEIARIGLGECQQLVGLTLMEASGSELQIRSQQLQMLV